MGSHKYKGIRKTDGPKGLGKKQARKGTRQQGRKIIDEARDRSTYFHENDDRTSLNTDNAFRMGFAEGYDYAMAVNRTKKKMY